jgi:hypothetical protein
VPKFCICENHPERATPMIGTFAFQGAEFWCAWCGATEGIFNSCKKVEADPVLAERMIEDETLSKEYLKAVSSLSCSRLQWEGKWISPHDLPQAAVEQYQAICKAWKYRVTIAA